MSTSPAFWKRCQFSDPLEESLGNLRSQSGAFAKSANDEIVALDISTANDALSNLNSTVAEIYTRSGRRCDILCEFTSPKDAEARERGLASQTGLIVVGGQALINDGSTYLEAPSTLYKIIKSGLTEIGIKRQPLDVIRDFVAMPSGSFAVVFYTTYVAPYSASKPNQSDCELVSTYTPLHVAIWDKRRPTLSKYPQGAFQPLSTIAANASLDQEDVSVALFWIGEKDFTGGAYAQLERLNLSLDQLVVSLLDPGEANEFASGNLSVYTLETDSIDRLIGYDLSEGQIKQLLDRGVPGVSTSATPNEVLLYLNQFTSIEKQLASCGLNLRSVSTGILATVDLNKTLKLNSGGEGCFLDGASLTDKIQEFANAVISAVNDAIQVALLPFQTFQQKIGAFIAEVEGIENALWSLVDPDATYGTSILACLFGGAINIPGLDLDSLLDGLLADIPGVSQVIDQTLSSISDVISTILKPLCFTGQIVDHVLSLFGVDVAAIPVVGCLTKFGVNVDFASLLGSQLPCLLEFLESSRAAISFAIDLNRVLLFQLDEIRGVIKAFTGGADIRFEASKACVGEGGEAFAFVTALTGLVA